MATRTSSLVAFSISTSAATLSSLLGQNISSYTVQTSSLIVTGAVVSSLLLTEGAVQNGIYVQNNILYFTSTPITGPTLARFQYVTLS
jgi:hypothetical protein